MNSQSSPKVLLHICCAVCAAEVIAKLRRENYSVSGYFYNPNIHPSAEYNRRLNEVKGLSATLSFPLLEGKYEPARWFELSRGLESDPEGGRRCEICFRMRLRETSQAARQKGFSKFTTTLSISPFKNSLLINSLGSKVDRNLFLARDFKKQDGFKKTLDFARAHGLYRQHYCGCIYSKKAESRE